ncbi:MAG: hypothetical protein Q9194_003193 [Teloschistes cf. exilis]
MLWLLMAFPFFGHTLIVSGATAGGSNTMNDSSRILGAPQPPRCRPQLGPSTDEHDVMDFDSCEKAIAKIPRDPRSTPGLINFYVDALDRSRTIPNVRIPTTWSDGISMKLSLTLGFLSWVDGKIVLLIDHVKETALSNFYLTHDSKMFLLIKPCGTMCGVQQD